MCNYDQISHNLLGGVAEYSGEQTITLPALLSIREWKQSTALTVMIFCKFTHTVLMKTVTVASKHGSDIIQEYKEPM